MLFYLFKELVCMYVAKFLLFGDNYFVWIGKNGV